MQISYKASRRAADVIAAMGRTEDLKFSPSNKLLAIAGYEKNKIAVFHIEIAKSAHGTKITLTDAFELYSKELNEPHGLDFLDEETIIVTNRSGDAILLQLPFGGTVSNSFELAPLGVISSGSAGPLSGPAAVSIFRMDQKLYEALICNNGSSNVTKHLIDLSAGCSVKCNEILLTKWLGVPDGISISKDRHWIAISNHKMRGVFLYEYTSLNASSEPDGILRYVFSPHGVRFTSDGEFIVVADGASPYLYIYTKNGSSWRGVHNPIKSLRVLNDEEFLRGRFNNRPGGGPKGIDVDNATNVLAVTCEGQSLAFFDWKAILESTGIHSDPGESQERDAREQGASELRYELEIQNRLNQEIKEIEEHTKEIAERTVATTVATYESSMSWRITAPLRRVSSALRSFVVQQPRA